MADLHTVLEALAAATTQGANQAIGMYRQVDLFVIQGAVRDQNTKVGLAIDNFHGPASSAAELLAIKNEAVQMAGLAFVLVAIATQRFEDAQAQVPK